MLRFLVAGIESRGTVGDALRRTPCPSSDLDWPPLAVSTNRPTIERSDSGYRRTRMVPCRLRSSHNLGSINRRVPAGRRACGTLAAIGVRPQRGVGLGLAQLSFEIGVFPLQRLNSTAAAHGRARVSRFPINGKT